MVGSNLRETFKSRHSKLDLGTDMIPAWSAISQINIYRLKYKSFRHHSRSAEKIAAKKYYRMIFACKDTLVNIMNAILADILISWHIFFKSLEQN